MKYQKYEISSDTLTFVNFADLHFGNRNCDKRMINNVIRFIAKHKCYWLGGGDYADAIIPQDWRFDARTIDKEFDTPRAQYKEIERLFRPIAYRCLGLLDGNHDIMHWKKHSHNYVEELCERLDVPYLTIDAYLRIYFKKFDANFNIYAHHGWTGARTSGGRINRIYDLFNIYPMLDLYVMNHIHALGQVEKKTSLFVDNNGNIRDKISYFLFGGSFLRGYVKNQISYVEEKTYIPTTLGSPVFKIIPRQGKLGINFDFEYKEIR